MRISISNIAWDAKEDKSIAALLHRLGIDAIDIAPGKYFPEPASAPTAEVSRVRQWWSDRGIEITGMQALLFGTSGLNVFGSAEVQEAMLQHLVAVCRIGSGLGARRLVFGSPKNRDRSGLDDRGAIEVAVRFFRRLGDLAAGHGVTICLEPNPVRYGANFMTTSEETARVVEEVGHPSIRMQFDTGALAINDEDPVAVLRRCASLIGHIHASDPDLVPLGDGATDHARMAVALKEAFPEHVVTIEMVATSGESHHISIERAVRVAIRYYRDAQTGS